MVLRALSAEPVLIAVMGLVAILSMGAAGFLAAIVAGIVHMPLHQRPPYRSIAVQLGVTAMLLAEYYFATGDETVLHALEEYCRILAEGQGMPRRPSW